ncbi:hypothetical protein G7Z17_g6563 [Cylindrodendrum hubeiense]|uniref:Uncharacterized protein n=1 Tax=Cylindrodendrum hubeiense TaxID=595255 RepID=A0A9P5H4F9_9HYPO|nr:hypothetical protein G7Z17_g6563 [Cylindrodendrum hubeiense]
MFLASLLRFISLLGLVSPAEAWDPSQARVPGIAFGLTPDAGTAAIRFPNSTVVHMARTEWNQSQPYRTFMRKADGPPADVERCHWLMSYFTGCGRDADFEAVKVLLLDLKEMVEAVLRTNICFADVVIADLGQTYQGRIIEEALAAIGLRQSTSVASAPKLAALAYSFENPDDNAPERLVLVIDYSKSHLNLAIFCDDEGITMEPVRQDYQMGLGASNEINSQHWGDVDNAIGQFLLSPFGDSYKGSPLPRHISKLVLYGDAMEQRFRDALMMHVKVGKELVEKAYVYSPAGAGAVPMAERSFHRQNSIDFYGEATFGCKWRSKLYHKRAHDEL